MVWVPLRHCFLKNGDGGTLLCGFGSSIWQRSSAVSVCGLSNAGKWEPAERQLGIFTFNADRWSAVFLLITGLAGTVTSIYAWGYAKSYLGKRLRLLGGLWNAFCFLWCWFYWLLMFSVFTGLGADGRSKLSVSQPRS